MTTFGDYAIYYDMLYAEKDYALEARDVAGLIKQFSPNANSILDLGCGTGLHAIELSRLGYQVVGIDRSRVMIDRAQAHEANSSLPEGSISFVCGDLRNTRLQRKFDILTALFHVMSYQVTDADLVDAFCSAREHLHPHGIFIFDGWYGPAVSVQVPTVRVKRVQQGAVSLLRLAEPELLPEGNAVVVNYTLLVGDGDKTVTDIVREAHRMRYFFNADIEKLASQAGFSVLAAPDSNIDGGAADAWSGTWVLGL